MEKIKLVLVDADAEFVRRAESILKTYEDINLAGISLDGASGMELVRKVHPDVVLFDLVLPGLDGISFLKGILAMKTPPMAICCTQFYSSVGLEAARNLGASYFLFKPVEIRALYESIKGCWHAYLQIRQTRKSMLEERSSSSLEIRNYLVSLGIPSRLLGCSYLAEAVRLAMEDISLTQNLSKGLYLEISRTMNTTPVGIERSIRNAISTAFQNGRLGEKMITCPSNKEFINYVLRTYST